MTCKFKTISSDFGSRPVSDSHKNWGANCAVKTLSSSGGNWQLGVSSACKTFHGIGQYATSLCQLFLSFSMWIFSQSPNVQKPPSQFLVFSQRELIHVWMFIQGVHDRKECQEPPNLLCCKHLFQHLLFKMSYVPGSKLRKKINNSRTQNII